MAAKKFLKDFQIRTLKLMTLVEIVERFIFKYSNHCRYQKLALLSHFLKESHRRGLDLRSLRDRARPGSNWLESIPQLQEKLDEVQNAFRRSKCTHEKELIWHQFTTQVQTLLYEIKTWERQLPGEKQYDLFFKAVARADIFVKTGLFILPYFPTTFNHYEDFPNLANATKTFLKDLLEDSARELADCCEWEDFDTDFRMQNMDSYEMMYEFLRKKVETNTDCLDCIEGTKELLLEADKNFKKELPNYHNHSSLSF